MTTSKLKVLVADDASAIQAFFAEIAATSPVAFEIVKAVNGREAMELLNKGGVNVAFIDVNMPEMSGIDALGEARKIGAKTFVTLISSEASSRRLEVARKLNVYEFLTKPFKPEDVHAILQTYCRVTQPAKVLIVDDSATTRKVITKVLTGSIFNLDIMEAPNGMAALRECVSGGVDVIFLDCNMPDLNGLDTLAHLKEIDPDIKVIMNSGERNDEKRRKALEQGAAAFLYKPFYPADIDRELHAVFGLKMPMLAHADEHALQPA